MLNLTKSICTASPSVHAMTQPSERASARSRGLREACAHPGIDRLRHAAYRVVLDGESYRVPCPMAREQQISTCERR